MDLEEEKPVGSLKRSKKCKFNKAGHEYILIEKGSWSRITWARSQCKHCGKLSWNTLDVEATHGTPNSDD